MENESIFCIKFYCGFRSTQPTVIIESYYQTYVNNSMLLALVFMTARDYFFSLKPIANAIYSFNMFT